MRKRIVIAGIVLLCCGIAFGAETARKGGKPMVILETSLGVIKVELYPDKAPVSVKNFLAYVKEGHYDGLIFHRVIRDFMVQGGGFTKEMKERGSKHPPIKNEADNGLKNDRGTLAMARTSVVDSATAQFFINIGEQRLPQPPGEDPARVRLRRLRKGHGGDGRRRQDPRRAHRELRHVPGRPR